MELTREQLYDMLWANGVGKTEKALGLKPTELKTICETYQIPRPSSGYWNALALGKPTEKTSLPQMDDNQPINTDNFIKKRAIRKTEPANTPQQTITNHTSAKNIDGKYPPRELPQEEPVTIYSVPEKLYAKDPIILDTKAKLREQHSLTDNAWSKKNPFKSTPEKWLDISVYPAQEDRALRVFHTIWRAAEAKGYHIYIKVDKGSYRTSCETYFQVRNHPIRVQLKEINRRIKDESSSWPSWIWVESGMLKFLCDKEICSYRHSYGSNERVAAQDTERTDIEDKIERIIEVLGEIADSRDRAEIERRQEEERRKQEEERKRQEEERKRLEAERQARLEERREEERDRVRELLFNADRVRVAAMIRTYADQYEATSSGKMPYEELLEKLQWMRDKADFIDPFIQRQDEWLAPKDISILLDPEIVQTSEERRSSYGYGHETTYSYWQLKNMWGRKR